MGQFGSIGSKINKNICWAQSILSLCPDALRWQVDTFMAHYWYSCGVPQQRQTDRQTDGTMGWFEWGANRNFSATHPLGLNDVSDVQVASSNKFSTTPSYIQPTPLAHNTSFLLNSWVPSPVTLSLPMIHRWYMAARPLSEQSADSGRRWKDSATTPRPNPTQPLWARQLKCDVVNRGRFLYKGSVLLYCAWHRLTCPVVHDQL